MDIDRRRAALFDREAQRYDRTRPGYPEALVDAVLDGAPCGMTVLDVACGTGLAARGVARRGARVLGVELNPNMAAIARRHGISTDVAAFETWDPAGRTFDVVTCGQAWHWLDPAVRTAKVASLLRPGGRLCLFWNVGRYPDDLNDALADAYRRALPPDDPPLVIGYAADATHDPTAELAAVADVLRADTAFTDARTASFPWTRAYTRDQWLDELASHSDHAAVPSGMRERLFDEIGATLDRFGGRFTMDYVTILVTATRA